ncbi:MAG TPA: UTP--glucose-1-phosphate uridylyltransferase [Candidatus Cloacimonadota bacterium]|nr:UTP--glucose-1-phosphate uridylyltransferase [Candidatus Cloacimonadota bacterium]HQB40554.1 UTP--glucose-1-phosphate uridylyltransferase [Candidatus Cloacimonadota bacterium]
MKKEMFIDKMKKDGLNDIIIKTFINYYQKLVDGEKGKLSKSEIKKPSEEKIVDYNKLEKQANDHLHKLAIIKLNGGLGTSMGLKKAKSLLPVKGELTFLDIIAKQVLFLREKNKSQVPIIFMNSFNTQADTLSALAKYENIGKQVCPLDFIQNKFPKIRKDNFMPLENKDDTLNWNPPGHGDIYSCLAQEGIIDTLLKHGIEYVFVSNSDNLGALADLKILTYMIESQTPFMMEVCQRTEMDKKGGHLAETKDGRLILRESAQCPADEVEEFQDIELYNYFNTNNLWIELKALKEYLEQNNNVIELPLIINPKKVEETDVIQLETAMGAAISIFKDSKAILVNRDRFAPVKKTQDLLLIWSDAYELKDDYSLQKVSKIDHLIELDSAFYGEIDQARLRFSEDIPSLKECNRFFVEGDITFGRSTVFKGNIRLIAKQPLKLDSVEISNY